MEILRIASFSRGNEGGNPAGVMLCETHPPAEEMQRIAAEIGYSETAFAAPEGDRWRVRYFAPTAEVPFCGHATIALAAALALRKGGGARRLVLNAAEIEVEGAIDGAELSGSLYSPPTKCAPVGDELLARALDLFGLTEEEIDPTIPPARIHAGADHLALTLRSRETLAAMSYPFEAGRQLMVSEGWITILLAHPDGTRRFHTRNAFAAGGLVEDPATGAATAAYAGLLRDIGHIHGGSIEVHQGEDMGVPCLIHADILPGRGSPVRLRGTCRLL